MKQLIDLKEFIRFLGVGGFAALLNILSRIGFDVFFGYTTSVILAFFVGLTTAYLLNRFWVFPTTGSTHKTQMLRFTLVNLLSLIFIWGISHGLYYIVFPAISFTFYPELIAHSTGVAVPAVTSYFAHKFYTFRGR